MQKPSIENPLVAACRVLLPTLLPIGGSLRGFRLKIRGAPDKTDQKVHRKNKATIYWYLNANISNFWCMTKDRIYFKKGHKGVCDFNSTGQK